MTIWSPDITDYPGPRYQAIAGALAADVASGRLPPGTRLPTHRDLAWRLGVTVGTVSRAYAEVARRGLIFGEVGRGTFVGARAGGPVGDMYDVRPAPGGDDVIDLGVGFPPAGEERAALPGALTALAADSTAGALLSYQHPAGIPHHRAAGRAWFLRRGLDVPADRVVVTTGAQHGLLVALAAAARPGERVATETLVYPGVRSAARMLGLRLENITMDEAGILPDAFAAACRAGLRAVHCVPTLQNPTNATMPEDRRRQIAAIAKAHDVAIIEDDLFGLLPAQAPRPLACFAPGRSYCLTSLSKTIAPGLRVGYLAVPEHALERVLGAVRASCWVTPLLTAEVAARWIADGTADRILAHRRSEIAARQALARSALSGRDYALAPGSLFLWLRLPEPWRSMEFAAEARTRGVVVNGAAPFAPERGELPPAVRVCLGGPPTRASLETGLRRLTALLADGALSSLSVV